MESNEKSKQEIWWQRVLESREYAGGVAAYCEKQGLNKSTLFYWRKKLGERKGVEKHSPFVPVELESKAEPRLPDAKWLASFASELIRGLS